MATSRRSRAIIAAPEPALTEDIAADRAEHQALFEGQTADPAKQLDALSRKYGIEKCAGDKRCSEGPPEQSAPCQ